MRSIDGESTEVNTEKSFKIKHFRVFGQPYVGCLDTRIFALRTNQPPKSEVELTG